MSSTLMARLDIKVAPDSSTACGEEAFTLQPICATANGQDHRLIEGDNLLVLRALSRQRTPVHLAYLDPPFFTQRVHERVRRRRDGVTGQIERTRTVAFDDRWDTLDDYLHSLSERLKVVRDMLTDDGCVIVHVDPQTSHYVKVLCDDIFGSDCFANEIIWRYRRWPTKQKNFQRVHDVLLRYRKRADVPPRFVQLYEPLAASTRATWGDRKQRADVDAQGRRKRSTKTSQASPGVPMGDVWEISIIAPVAKERTGYPTQKPRKLLHRVIEACSYEGDVVLDPYVGSGTTMAVAADLGRKTIGIDASGQAIEVSLERLKKQGTPVQLERLCPA